MENILQELNLIDADQLREIFKISKSTLSRWMNQDLKYYKRGQQIYFNRIEVKDWVKSWIQNQSEVS